MINPQALETFGKYDKKSLMAGVVVGQGLKGRARAPQTPAPAGFPQGLWDDAAERANAMIASLQGAGQSGETQTEATPDNWQFDKDAFCFGIAAGRSLEGWEIDGGVSLSGYSKIIYYIRLDSPCTVTVWLNGVKRNGEMLLIDWGDSRDESIQNVNYTDHNYTYYGRNLGYVIHDYENGGGYIVTIVTKDSISPCGYLESYPQFAGAGCCGIYISEGEGKVNLNASRDVDSEILYAAYFDNIPAIRTSAFLRCVNLTSVIIPDSVTEIHSHAFDGCCNLTNIHIPDSMVKILDYAFHKCSSLTNIHIPSSVTKIGSEYLNGMVFAYSGITSFVIPHGITYICYGLFQGCTNLTNITIPDTVTKTFGSAFRECRSLETVAIPDSLTVFGGYDFDNCTSLKSITIPNGTKHITGLFCNCSSLESFIIPDSVIYLGGGLLAGGVFSGCESLKSIVIPNGVTEIGDACFQNCHGLVSVTIPSSVESIGDQAFASIYHGFHIYYAGTKEQWDAIQKGKDLFMFSYGNGSYWENGESYPYPSYVMYHYNSTEPDDVHED